MKRRSYLEFRLLKIRSLDHPLPLIAATWRVSGSHLNRGRSRAVEVPGLQAQIVARWVQGRGRSRGRRRTLARGGFADRGLRQAIRSDRR